MGGTKLINAYARHESVNEAFYIQRDKIEIIT